jgi:hypothetical protein
MTGITKRKWIDAAKQLERDPRKQVLCPCCGEGTLIASDTRPPDNPNLVERYLRCPACHAYDIAVVRDPV